MCMQMTIGGWQSRRDLTKLPLRAPRERQPASGLMHVWRKSKLKRGLAGVWSSVRSDSRAWYGVGTVAIPRIVQLPLQSFD